jgi:hypothetical protein
MPSHWFWWALTDCVRGLVFEPSPVYVAIKGAKDIKNMLARLDATRKREAEER